MDYKPDEQGLRPTCLGSRRSTRRDHRQGLGIH
jgi:hypothetical protein